MEEVAIGMQAGGDKLTLDQLRLLKKAATFTAVAGIIFSVLFLLAFYLLADVPRGPKATDEVLVAYYESGDADIVAIVSLYLIPFAGIAFLWFVVSLRMWISVRATRTIDLLFSNVQLVAGIVYLTLFLAAAAAMSVNAIVADLDGGQIDPSMARDFPQFGSSLFFVFAIRMGAMFVFTTMTISRQSSIVPKWFVICGYILGLVMLLSSTFNRAMILAFPIWTLVLCAIIFYYTHRGYPAFVERRGIDTPTLDPDMTAP